MCFLWDFSASCQVGSKVHHIRQVPCKPPAGIGVKRNAWAAGPLRSHPLPPLATAGCSDGWRGPSAGMSWGNLHGRVSVGESLGSTEFIAYPRVASLALPPASRCLQPSVWQGGWPKAFRLQNEARPMAFPAMCSVPAGNLAFP